MPIQQWPEECKSRYNLPRLGLLILTLVLALPAPLLAVDEQTVYRTFQTFAKEWMTSLDDTSRRNLHLAGQRPAQPGVIHNRYACYGPECEIWIKKIDSAQTPYLGFIRYPEKHYRKKINPTGKEPVVQDVLLTTFPVTEIFRFTDNRWVH